MHPTLMRPMHALLRLAGLRCRRTSQPIVRPPSLEPIHLSSARVLADRDHLLGLVPIGSRVAEVGVGFGDFSRKILDVVKPCEFVAVDLFERHASHEASYRRRFNREIEDGIVQIRRGWSHDVLEQLRDDYFDLIYIDAGHSYERVKQDVDEGRRKVRPGGLLAMDDYERSDPSGFTLYGVKRAAHELCLSERWKVAYVALEGADAAANVVLQRPTA